MILLVRIKYNYNNDYTKEYFRTSTLKRLFDLYDYLNYNRDIDNYTIQILYSH